MSEFREILDDHLIELVLQVGRDVTDSYASKHGLYEGMSIQNKLAKDKTLQAIMQVIDTKLIGDEEGTLSSLNPRRLARPIEHWHPDKRIRMRLREKQRQALWGQEGSN